SSVLKALPSCPVIDPIDEEVDRFLNKKYYQICSANISADDKKILFDKTPTDNKIEKTVKDEFNIELTNTDLKNAKEQIRSFLKRGKQIKRTDLQMIIENSIRKGKTKTIKIIDFSVNSEKNKQPVANIELKYKNNTYKESSTGVGPVDALIKAFHKALLKNNMNYILTDYKVDIKTKDSDSTVDIKMAVTDMKTNTTVIAMGTSPDIIVASIEAFEEASNLLHNKNR
ncbi:MAG: hypothetical protein KAJ19_19520, partial [Gammaproteobacteria bacterium]|nr:hypothetical protein [Gammaproteobacteria bacterium]